MDRYPWLRDVLLEKPGAVFDFKAEWNWHRCLVGGKMFAAIFEKEGRDYITLKCEPEFGDFLRRTFPDIAPGYYMDKRCWNTVDLGGAVPDEVLREMCARSYALVFAGLPRKTRLQIGGGKND